MFHQHVFRELERQQRWRQLARRQDPQHIVRKIGPPELTRRDVHHQSHRRHPGATPGEILPARAAQRPFHAREVDERRMRHELVVPAHELDQPVPEPADRRMARGMRRDVGEREPVEGVVAHHLRQAAEVVAQRGDEAGGVGVAVDAQQRFGPRARTQQRAGIVAPVKGAHVLRHTAATEMLRHGVPLEKIGLVLRHRGIDTTAYYAKADVTLLKQIAQPWPEVL